VAAGPELPAADKAPLGDANLTVPIGHEEDVEAAQQVREAKLGALETAWRTAVSKDPDKDPAKDATVITKQGEDTTADRDGTAKVTLDTEDERQLVGVANASIPDARWQLIRQYGEAHEALDRFAKIKATDLKKALVDTETALAKAIAAQRKVERTLAVL